MARKVKEQLTLKGRISISRVSSNQGDGYIKVEIVDDLSISIIAEVELDFASFTLALTGLSSVECKLTTQDPATSVVGKKREHKTENVPHPGGYGLTEAKARKVLAPYEVDGWVGRWDDLNNGHRKNSNDGTCKVAFIRFVDAN